MRKISIILCVILLLCITLTSCAANYQTTSGNNEKTKYVFLIAGMDDAAANTDVLFTLSYDSSSLCTRIAQIPRDTYMNFGGSQNKINQFYASRLSAGVDKYSAMTEFAELLEAKLGTEFDGFIGVNLSVLRKVVDSLGGVDIELSSDMTISVDNDKNAISLKAGTNHIDGDTAEKFVRFRSGYAMGDLGRVDAQKIFLNALFTKVASGVSLPLLLDIVKIVQNETVTDLSFTKLINLIFNSMNEKGEKTTYYATLPGEPVIASNGLSYYVLNRKSTAEMLKNYMFSYQTFDPEHSFVNYNETSMVNVYEDDGIPLREYSKESLSDMRIIGTAVG